MLLSLIISCLGCSETEELSDAYGNFEATITTISAETNGKLLVFSVEEGSRLVPGQPIGLIDTVALDLQRKQLLANIGVLPSQLRTAEPDVRVLNDRKSNLIRERDRVSRLVAAKAATEKQLDDINGEIDVIDQQIQSLKANTTVANRGIMANKAPLLAQIDIINDQISKAYLHNPVGGTVLTKLAEPAEMLMVGSPLYRIASLDTLTLRAYATAASLQSVAVGDIVKVSVDDGVNDLEDHQGTITWIADQAEFTPKTIQTKEERVNLVYAIKIAVPNSDGKLKLGMPAEVNWQSESTNQQAQNQE